MSNIKSPQASIAGRIAGAAIAGALLLAGPAAAVAMAGPAAAAPGTQNDIGPDGPKTTNINGEELTDEQIAERLNKNLPGNGLSLNPFKKGNFFERVFFS